LGRGLDREPARLPRPIVRLRSPSPSPVAGRAGISWAAILVRRSKVSVYTLVFCRLDLSLLVITGALTIRNEWSALARLHLEHVPWLGLAGFLLAFHFVTWFASLDLTTVARRGSWGSSSHVGAVCLCAAVVLATLSAVRREPFVGYAAREWWTFVGLAAGPVLLGHRGCNWALR
jgi:hypothetical protein